MKEELVSKFIVACLTSFLSLLAGIILTWNNLTNQITEVKSELRSISQQIFTIKTVVENHVSLPAHPVAEERTKQLVKEVVEIYGRLAKLETKMP
jgi:archaellum component FlaC